MFDDKASRRLAKYHRNFIVLSSDMYKFSDNSVTCRISNEKKILNEISFQSVYEFGMSISSMTGTTVGY